MKIRAFVVLVLITLVAAQETRAQALTGPNTRTVVDTIRGGVGGVAVDRAGNVYVADFGDHVWKVTPSGQASLFATGLYGSSGNAVDSRGNLIQSNFFGGYLSRIDRNGNAEVMAEGLTGPVGVALDPGDTAYVVQCSSNEIAKVSPSGRVQRISNSPLLNCPNGITRVPDGRFFVVNFSDGALLEVSAEGVVSEFAVLPGGGNGHITFARGDLYATSFQGNRIYRVTLDGTVEPFAGTGAFGETDGPNHEATFIFPNGIAAGAGGDRLFVNDFMNRSRPGLEVPPAPVSSLRQIMLPTFSSILSGALQDGGIPGMEEAYRAWKTSPSTIGVFTQIEVNAMGYALMQGGYLPAAIRLFELNVQSYPNAFNPHDSLGEAYMTAGRKDDAIASYERSLKLNPGNTNATDKLKELRGG